MKDCKFSERNDDLTFLISLSSFYRGARSKTGVARHYFLSLEDHDWLCSSLFAVGFPISWPFDGMHHFIHFICGLLLHLFADYSLCEERQGLWRLRQKVLR